MTQRRTTFDSRKLATELATRDGALRGHRDFGAGLMRELRQAVDACIQPAGTSARAVLRLESTRRNRTFDLAGEGGSGPVEIGAGRRLPPADMRRGLCVCITLDRWPPRRVLVETFKDGHLHGAWPGFPAMAQVADGRTVEGYWLAGHDVTQAVVRPASSYAQVAGWSGDLANLSMTGHLRLMEVVAAAEAAGVPVAVHAAALPGIVLYSPGRGQPYAVLGKADYKAARAEDADLPSGMLSIQSNASGENWKAVRTVRGLLHGDTAELPAVCASRMGEHGQVETSEALMREGVRVGGPEAGFKRR